MANMVQKAKELRIILKDKGYKARDFSIKSTYNCIRVRIKNINIPRKKIEKLAMGYENIHWDEGFGEILSGGNNFVFVNYDCQYLDEKKKEYTKEAEEIIDNFDYDKSNLLKDDGRFTLSYQMDANEITLNKCSEKLETETCYCFDNVLCFNVIKDFLTTRSYAVEILEHALMWFYAKIEHEKQEEKELV